MTDSTLTAKKVNPFVGGNKRIARAIETGEKNYFGKNPVFETLKQFLFYCFSNMAAAFEFVDAESAVDDSSAVDAEENEKKRPFERYCVDGIICDFEQRDDGDYFVALFDNKQKYEVNFGCNLESMRKIYELPRVQKAFIEKAALYLLTTICNGVGVEKVGGDLQNPRHFLIFEATRQKFVTFCSESERRNLSAALAAVAEFLDAVQISVFKAQCQKGRKKYAAQNVSGRLLYLQKDKETKAPIIKGGRFIFGVDAVFYKLLCEFKRVAISRAVFALAPAYMRAVLNCIFKFYGGRKMKFARFSIQKCVQSAFSQPSAKANRHWRRQKRFLDAVLNYAQKLTGLEFEFESPRFLKRKIKARNAVADLMAGGNILIKAPPPPAPAVDAVVQVQNAAPAAAPAVDDSKIIAIGDFTKSTLKQIVGVPKTAEFSYFEYGRGLDGGGVFAVDCKEFMAILQSGAPPDSISKAARGFLAKVKDFCGRGLAKILGRRIAAF